MNVYYNIDDLNLEDGPIIVNMIIERANGQQSVSSLAPDAVVEEFDIQGLVDSAEVEDLKRCLRIARKSRDDAWAQASHLENVKESLVTDLERAKSANLRLTSELEDCKRVRDEHYHNYNGARGEVAELSGKLRELRNDWQSARVDVTQLSGTIDELRKEIFQLTEERDRFSIELLRHKLVCNKTLKDSYEAACRERYELKAKLEAAEKALRGES